MLARVRERDIESQRQRILERFNEAGVLSERPGKERRHEKDERMQKRKDGRERKRRTALLVSRPLCFL